MCLFFDGCSPAMMLNILGLRMAGQISLRKTKPLEEERMGEACETEREETGR